MAEVNVSRKHDGPEQQQTPGIATREGPHAMRRGWPGMQSRRNPFDVFSSSPFAMLRRLNEEMDRAFFGGLTSRNQGDWMPAIDIAERNGELQIHADLPGIQKEDVKVEVSNGVLTISGERRQEKEEESEGYYRTERSYGSFSRSIPLPEGADIDKARGNFNNGVLELAIPMPGNKQTSKQIPIQTGTSAKQQNQTQNQPQGKTATEQGAQSADPASLGKEVASEGRQPNQQSKAS
jgi:HSP20 family protein